MDEGWVSGQGQISQHTVSRRVLSTMAEAVLVLMVGRPRRISYRDIDADDIRSLGRRLDYTNVGSNALSLAHR